MSFDSLTDAFAAPPSKTQCKMCDLLDGLEEGREAVEAALAAPLKVWSTKEIHRRLVDLGHDIGETTVGTHRTRHVSR